MNDCAVEKEKGCCLKEFNSVNNYNVCDSVCNCNNNNNCSCR